MNFRTLIFIAALFLPSIGQAGGSASWDEVKAVLDQAPQVANIVYSTLDCKASGYADCRIGGMYPLGGKRLGPYRIQCRIKGANTKYDLLLTVNTVYELYDDAGKKSDIENATRVDEKFESIELGIYKEDCEKPGQ